MWWRVGGGAGQVPVYECVYGVGTLKNSILPLTLCPFCFPVHHEWAALPHHLLPAMMLRLTQADSNGSSPPGADVSETLSREKYFFFEVVTLGIVTAMRN